MRGSMRTAEGYKYAVSLFYQHTGIKDHNEFLALSNLEVEDKIYDWIELLRHKTKCTQKTKNWKESPISPNSIDNYLKPIKKFLEMNGRENDVRWKMIWSTLPNRERKSGFKGYEKKDIRKLVEASLDTRSKALILFLASNSARKGIFDLELGHQLLLRHLVEMKYNESKMYAVLLYAEEGLTVEEMLERESGDSVSGAEYWGFLTPEATAALDDYLDWRKEQGDPLDEDSPIFCRLTKGKKEHTLEPLSLDGVFQIINRILRRTTIKRIKKRNRFDIQAVHGIRKFSNKALKMTDGMKGDIAEKLMAHKIWNDEAYHRPTREECHKEFCKAIPELTIDDSLKTKVELEKVRDENEQLKTQNAENRLIKREVEEAKAAMAEIKAQKKTVEVQKTESVGLGTEMARELMKDPAMRKEIMRDLFKDEAVKKDLLQLIKQSLSS